MDILPFHPSLAPQVAEAYNRAVARVPHCYPVSPEELASANHERLVEILKGFRISTDNYTRTHNPIHMKFVQEFYEKVYDNGHIVQKPEEQFYCENDQIFLPDRFVKGMCPVCGYEDAEGDQCPSCGRLLTPTELREPTCSVCGNPLVGEHVHQTD